ncbi:hypothetical protein KY314_02460, partial [Candidatus Woesearchaeota archaeon]|nr:hypothetical protein [Candidatus Woesearchaeota archaeon]
MAWKLAENPSISSKLFYKNKTVFIHNIEEKLGKTSFLFLHMVRSFDQANLKDLAKKQRAKNATTYTCLDYTRIVKQKG